MSVVDILETEFNLKGNYDAQMRKNIASTSAFKAESAKIDKAAMFSNLATAAVSAGIAVAGVTIALSANAMRDSAAFDSLVKGLEAVEGSAEKARKKIEDIRKIAAAPGIGFEQAVSGYGGLRRGGISEGLSERLVREAGNANAASGGDVGKFEQIMRAFGQIAAKPKLQGDELLQLNEAGLPIQKMLKEAFGTSDTEALSKMGKTPIDILEGLVRVMEKMPRVGGGFQNVLDNISDALKRASVSVGDGLNASLMPQLERFGDELTKVIDSGRLEELGVALSGLATSSMEAVGGFQGLTEAMVAWADGAALIIDKLKAKEDKPAKEATAFDFTPAGAIIKGVEGAWNYAMGNDIRSQVAKMESRTGQMQDDPRFKGFQSRLNAEAEVKKLQTEKEAEKSSKKESAATQILKKIEENTKVLPDMTRLMSGDRGELTRLGVTAHEIKAQRVGRKLAHNMRTIAVMSGISSGRLTKR